MTFRKGFEHAISEESRKKVILILKSSQSKFKRQLESLNESKEARKVNYESLPVK